MRAILGLAALFLAACATNSATLMMPITGASPVEEQILISYRTYAQANASVGAADIVYSVHPPSAAGHYQNFIRGRLERDLTDYYGGPVHRAERVYLLFGVREGKDLIQVVRLGVLNTPREDRQTFDDLQQVETLTYIFEPSTHALIGVFGPVAREY